MLKRSITYGNVGIALLGVGVTMAIASGSNLGLQLGAMAALSSGLISLGEAGCRRYGIPVVALGIENGFAVRKR